MGKVHVRLGICVIGLLLACGCSREGDGEVLFQDSFDDPESGWGAGRRSRFDRGYEGGAYYFEVYESDWLTWAYPGDRYEDVTVEVDASLASTGREGHFGILCRHVNDRNFYYFAISPDGYYAIYRRAGGGALEVLSGGGSGMLPAPAVDTTGRAANHLRVTCAGDALSLYVNGVLLETVTDDALTRGHVGLAVGSGPVGGVRVHFDDVVVRGP